MVGIKEAKKKKELGIDQGVVVAVGENIDDSSEEALFLQENECNPKQTQFKYLVISTKIGRILEISYPGKDLQWEDGFAPGDELKLVIHDDYSAEWVKVTGLSEKD
ncbi:MAG: hypothetical protein ABEI74_04850 [Candidatus Pacearchaeota archaeon]